MPIHINMIKFKVNQISLACLLSLFIVLSAASNLMATTTLNKTFVDHTNGTITVTWSGFSGNVNIALYKGISDSDPIYHKTDQPASGFSTLGPDGWEYRCDYRIKVELRSEPSIYEWAQYNGDFDFCVGSLNVTYPNGGETIERGQTLSVLWNSTNLTDNIQIDLCKGPSNSVVSQLAASVSNSGNATVTMPSNISDGSDYKIGISNARSDVNDGQVWDYSNNYLTIQTPPSPVPPTLTAPVDNADLPIGENITFQWINSSGSVTNSSIKVCADSSMSTGCQAFETGLIQTIVSDSLFTPGVPYYWQARSKTVTSEWGIYGPTPPRSFTCQSVATEPVFTPLHRLYRYDSNANTRDHFYTISVAERNDAISLYGYTDEGIECYISDRNFPGGIPLYRFYWGAQNSHYYTTSETEKNQKVLEGYVFEKIEGYIHQNPDCGMVPLHRLKQSNDTPYHYFLSTKLLEYLNVLGSGYIDENTDGIGYVQSYFAREPAAHGRPQANYGGIDLGSGAFRGLNNLDIVMKGRGPSLLFSHFYNSFDYNHYPYPMGPGWKHNLESSIEEDISGNVLVKWGNGSISCFVKTGSEPSDYIDKAGNHDQMIKIGEGYEILRKNQTVYKYSKFSVNPWPGTPQPLWFLQDNFRILLIEIEDWAGNKLIFDREAVYGTLNSVRDGFGRKLVFNYSTPSLQLESVNETVNDVVKRAIYFTYNSDYMLETFVDTNGNTTRYKYYNEPLTKHHHLLESITYPKGNTVLIDYGESSGQVTSIKDQNGASSKIEYTPSSGMTAVTDPENNIYDYIHTGNMLTAYKGGNDVPWTTIDRTDTRNPNLPTHVKDKNGNTTDYEYDANGNLKKITNACGKIADYVYNDKNNIAESTEFHDQLVTNPPKTTYTYDLSDNRLRSITNPENDTIQLSYYANNQVQTITDGRGFSTIFTYDSYGNLAHVTDAKGNLTQYENDYAGRTISVTDAESIKTAFTYDANDHPKDIMNYAKGGQTILRAISRLYDTNGNLDSVHWINNGVSTQTQYTYDTRDRLESVIKPGNLDKVFAYYETDLVRTRTDYNNATTTYYYDDHNRLQRTRYPDQTDVVITRDNNGNVKTVTGQNGTSSFTYNNLNLIETYTDPYGKTVSYLYNDAGNISKITYPGVNKDVDYTYDNTGRLKTVTDWNNGSLEYFYDAAGNLKEAQRRVNGTATITTSYSLDQASRLTGLMEKQGAATLWSYTFDLDGVGNHKSVDAVNEPLVGAVPPSNVSYSNDKATNRLLSAGSTTYTYDNNGNRKTRSEGGVTTLYSWDYANRLIHMTTPGQTDIEYIYDGMGNRIAKIANGTTKRYVLGLNSPMSRVLSETDDNGVITGYYIYGLGLVSRINADGSRRFYHFNQRGDTVALSNDSGVVTDKYAYGEYGQIETSQGTTPNPFKFVGRYGVMDEENGLCFMRARFYDAKVGRFLSEDPLGFGGGDWNLYAYVGGNPLVRIDPKGLWMFQLLISAADAIAHTEPVENFLGGITYKLLFEGKQYSEDRYMKFQNAAHYVSIGCDIVGIIGVGKDIYNIHKLGTKWLPKSSGVIRAIGESSIIAIDTAKGLANIRSWFETQ